MFVYVKSYMCNRLLPDFLGFWTRLSTGTRPLCFTNSSGSAKRLVYIYIYILYLLLYIAICTLYVYMVFHTLYIFSVLQYFYRICMYMYGIRIQVFLSYWRTPAYNLTRMLISIIVALIFGSA